jgi:microsomal dipeptidase-like Zn-dependent dipeptidase
MHGLEDMPMVWNALAQRGYSNELLENIFYNNFLRIF